MKRPKKKLRPFRTTDTLYSLIEKAAESEEMSINQWIEFALRTQLKNGITKEGIDIEEAEEFAFANAMEKGCESIGQILDKLDSTKMFWRDMIRALALVNQIRIDEQKGKPMEFKEVDRTEFELSASAFEDLDNTAKSHGTTMALISDKLIADFLAKPKREQKRILEE